MKHHFKSVFISDTHLGTADCQEDNLLEFLDSFKADNLFLVGDIIDGWALQRKHYWSKTQTEILRKILKLSEKMNVIYVPGNHDEFVRPFFKYDIENIGNVKIIDSKIYHGLDGRKYYVTHGDYFDHTMKIPRVVIQFAAFIWDFIPQFSKYNYQPFMNYMYKWLGTERIINRYIKKHGYDCSITGHTHAPKIKETYMNCGDWTLNCTALVENLDGTWQLIRHDKRRD